MRKTRETKIKLKQTNRQSVTNKQTETNRNTAQNESQYTPRWPTAE